MDSAELKPETKRGRVRRCLIEPLIEAGFRKLGNVKADRHEAFLVKLADHLGYMEEDQLAVLKSMLVYRGQGPSKDAWPSMAHIMSLAETVAPRPVEEHPTIVSWFRSARGAQAKAEGTLVAEFLFLEKRKRPPLSDGDWRAVRERAAEWTRQVVLIEERQARGAAAPDDGQWLAWYRAIEARAETLVEPRRGGA
ncbi:hypothetical protein [Roseivivax sp. THAF197b]|uniref:hypothetical protein n=1 Tax=Roseivivax sp. THAF197b TaxID=2588299 RepID=UPI001268AAE4|nr:hypothetical protein [Roseivivax sp. THAF197b]QFS83999.1 hypothetical protein FIV09_14275 [Roseivivax sp. THAF197b]